MKHIFEMAKYKKVSKDKQTLIKTQRTKALKSKEFKELLSLGLEVVNTKLQDSNMTITLSSKNLRLDLKSQWGGVASHKYKYLTYLITANFDEPTSVEEPSGPDRYFRRETDPLLYRVRWDAHITTGRKWVQFPSADKYKYSSLISVFMDIKKDITRRLSTVLDATDLIASITKAGSNKEAMDKVVKSFYKIGSYYVFIDYLGNKKLQDFLIKHFTKHKTYLYAADELLTKFASKETRAKIEKDTKHLGKQFGFFDD